MWSDQHRDSVIQCLEDSLQVFVHLARSPKVSDKEKPTGSFSSLQTKNSYSLGHCAPSSEANTGVVVFDIAETWLLDVDETRVLQPVSNTFD